MNALYCYTLSCICVVPFCPIILYYCGVFDSLQYIHTHTLERINAPSRISGVAIVYLEERLQKLGEHITHNCITRSTHDLCLKGDIVLCDRWITGVRMAEIEVEIDIIDLPCAAEVSSVIRWCSNARDMPLLHVGQGHAASIGEKSRACFASPVDVKRALNGGGWKCAHSD